MNINEIPQALLERLAAPPLPPLEAATKFLNSFFADADGIEEAWQEMARLAARNPRFILQGLIGIESLLADTLVEEGLLANLVAWEANWVLDDPSDEGAKEWLKTVAEKTRDILGENQPPRREAVTTIQQ